MDRGLQTQIYNTNVESRYYGFSTFGLVFAIPASGRHPLRLRIHGQPTMHTRTATERKGQQYEALTR